MIPIRHRVSTLPLLVASALTCLALSGLGCAARAQTPPDTPAAAPSAPLAPQPAVPAAAASAEQARSPGEAAPESAASPHHRTHTRHSPAQVLDDQVLALTKELELTPEQQRRARDILIRQRMALLDLRKNGAPDKVAASHAVIQRSKEDMRAMLTPEQRLKYFVDAPQDKLSPAQVDRDYWIKASQAKAGAATPDGPANPSPSPSGAAKDAVPAPAH